MRFLPPLLFSNAYPDLRGRIQSVKNSKKITDAMKLVASAKLRRAQEAVVMSRPFAESLQGVFGDVVRRLEGTDVAEGPLFAEREVKNITLVIIAGDRGLCGAYNNFVIKRAAARWDELKAAGMFSFFIVVFSSLRRLCLRCSHTFNIPLVQVIT